MASKKATKETETVEKTNKLETAMSWLQLGVDFDARRIEVNFEVNEQMASFIIRALLKMAEISSAPIHIYLSSGGGIVYDGLAIYDAIQACPCEVIIYASGKIMSSAFIIFLAGDKRIASKNITFMMHSISFSSGDEGTKLKDREIDVIEAKRLNNIFLDILTERTKRNRKWWYRQILSHDKYFDLKEAQDCGIVSATVSPTVKKKTKVRTKRRK